MDRQNKNAVVLERMGEGRIILEMIKDALEGMVNGKKVQGRRRYQMIDNIMKMDYTNILIGRG